MKYLSRISVVSVFVLMLFLAPPGRAQAKSQKSQSDTAAPANSSTQKTNIQEYINLLRTDVRQQKAEIMGAVMALNAQDAAKFWPIYSDYDTQLTKLNDQRVQTIKEYAQSYDDMTDQRADELVQRSLAYQKQRSELLARTYNKVKDALGGVTAARFAMVEHQLLLIIDLQIASSLPWSDKARSAFSEKEILPMRKSFVWVIAFLAILVVRPIFGTDTETKISSSGQDTANATASKKKLTVPAGTRILIRTTDAIDSTKQKAGYRFTASLETNLQAQDTVVAPRGTTLYGRLTQASSAGRMSGSSELTIELTDIVINGTAYPLLTSTYEVKGKGEGGSTAKKVVGGAGLGALIGGIAGGGKGAAIGAAAGGGAGTAASAAKKGQQVQIPSESLIEFRLQEPVSLPVAG